MRWFLQSPLYVILPIGMLGLVRWLPIPVQRLFATPAEGDKTRFDFVLGGIGAVCYLAQISLLLAAGLDLIEHQPPELRSPTIIVIAVCTVLFGAGTINFLRNLMARPATKK